MDLAQLISLLAQERGWGTSSDLWEAVREDRGDGRYQPSRRTAVSVWGGHVPSQSTWNQWADALGVEREKFCSACALSISRGGHGGMSASSPSDDRAAS